MEEFTPAPDDRRYRNHSVDDDGLYRRGSIGTSSEGENSSRHALYRRSSVSSTTSSSDLQSIQVKASLLDELKERQDEHPLLPLVHHQLAVVHATCKAQRARMRQWKDDELDLAMREEDDHYDDVERFVLIVEAMQAKIESMQPSASNPPTPSKSAAVANTTTSGHAAIVSDTASRKAIETDLALTKTRLAAVEAVLAETLVQRKELEAQAKGLRDVNDELSARVTSWKQSQPDKDAAVERTWQQRQSSWETTTTTLEQRVVSLQKDLLVAQQRGDAVQKDLLVAQQRGDAVHRQWSELQLTHHDTLEHLKQAYRDVIDANGKLQDERRFRLAGDAKIQEYSDREAAWKTERTDLESKRRQLDTDLSQSRAELLRLTEDLATKSQQQLALQQQLDDRHHDRERHAASWRDRHDNVAAQLDAAHATIATLNANLHATNDRLAATTTQLEQATQAARDADAGHQELHDRVAHLQQSLQSVETVLARRTKEKNDAVAAVARLNELHAEVVAALNEKERVVDSASSVLRQKQDAIDALEASIDAKDDEVARLKRQSSTTAAGLEEQFKRLQAFDELSMAYHDTRIAYEARQIDVEHLESQLHAAEKEVAALQQSLLERQEQLDAAAHHQRDLEERFRELQTICHELVAKNEHAEYEIHELHHQKSESVDAVRSAYDELKAAHAKLQDTLCDVEHDASVKLQEMEAKVSQLQDEVDKKEHQLESLTAALDQHQSQLDRVTQERHSLTQTNQTLDAKCAALETQVDSLRQKHAELEDVIRTNQKTSSEWRRAVDQAANEVKRLERELHQVQSDKTHDLAAASERLQALEDENHSLKDRARVLAEKHSEMSNQLQALTSLRDAETKQWQVSIAQWTAARERSQAMVEALRGAVAEKESALVLARQEHDHVRSELETAKAQLQRTSEQRQVADARVVELVATNERLQVQVASQSQSFQAKHVEEFASLREACHDVSVVNRMLTTEREGIHARLRQWLATFANPNDVKATDADDDLQGTMDKLERVWHDQTETTRKLADTVTKLNANLMATVDGSVRFEEEVDAMVRQLLVAMDQRPPPTNQASPRDGAVQDAFAHAIAMVQAIKKQQGNPAQAKATTTKHDLCPTEPHQDATTAVVATNGSRQLRQHDVHVAQLNDHLSHLMQQCLSLQARNDKYKKQLHTMRQREKLLERDLLLAIK